MRKFNLFAVFAVFAAVLALSSCKDKPKSDNELILGKWKVEKVVAPAEEAPAPANTFFTFNADGSFVGVNFFDDFSAMTGNWTLANKVLVLSIEEGDASMGVETLTEKEMVLVINTTPFGDVKVYLSK